MTPSSTPTEENTMKAYALLVALSLSPIAIACSSPETVRTTTTTTTTKERPAPPTVIEETTTTRQQVESE
jgi:hypothetical protein